MPSPKNSQDKRFKLVPEMEGTMARWYARNRGSAGQLEEYRTQAGTLTEDLPSGSDLLEVAPGPGYLSIELARLGRFQVTGLDVGRTFVTIASENARLAEVHVDFRHGDVHAMPFDAGSFDMIVCQAAFKNFGRPLRALDEMHRVLRDGGTAVIQDLRREASGPDLGREVTRMQLSGPNAVITKWGLAMLRRRALSQVQFERLAEQSAFGGCTVGSDGIIVTVRLTKHSTV